MLISDTIALLRSFGGKASAVSVVDFVMKIRKPDRAIAKMLAADLISNDPRLTLNGDMVELLESEFEARDLGETEFVVFDLETTGSKAPPCRITEIGAYRVRTDALRTRFKRL